MLTFFDPGADILVTHNLRITSIPLFIIYMILITPSSVRVSALKSNNFPWRPYQGRGRYPAHEKDRVCLPLKDTGAGTASPPNQ